MQSAIRVHLPSRGFTDEFPPVETHEWCRPLEDENHLLLSIGLAPLPPLEDHWPHPLDHESEELPTEGPTPTIRGLTGGTRWRTKFESHAEGIPFSPTLQKLRGFPPLETHGCRAPDDKS